MSCHTENRLLQEAVLASVKTRLCEKFVEMEADNYISVLLDDILTDDTLLKCVHDQRKVEARKDSFELRWNQKSNQRQKG